MTKPLSVVILFALLGGCVFSQGPANQYFPTTHQRELFSASHWKILANQTAKELRQSLPPSESAVWLQQDDSSPFSSGFGDFLADELVHRGLRVSSDHGSRIIKFKVEVVHHRSGPPNDPLKFTFLGAAAGLGVWAGEASPFRVSSSLIPPIGLAVGGLIDAKRNLMPPATSTEVVITTKIFEGGYQVGGTNDVFYIQTANSEEYMPVPIIPIVGS